LEESDDGRKGRDIGGGGAVFERGEVDVPVVNGDEDVLVSVHRFDGETSRQVGRRPLAPVGSEGKAFEGVVNRVGEAGIRGGSRGERSVGGNREAGGVLRVDATPWRKVSRWPYAVARERGGNLRTRVGVNSGIPWM
jgi:hypothetical protein